MRLPPSLHHVALSSLVAGTLAAAVQSASATPFPVAERYAARAGAQVAEISVLGRTVAVGSAITDSSLEAIGRRLSATATGTGADVSPATRSVARFNDATATGGRKCAALPIAAAAGELVPDTARASASRDLPVVDASPVCGAASVVGDADGFRAESIGGGTRIAVKLPETLQSLVGRATGRLGPRTMATPVGDLVHPPAPLTAEATKAIGALNGVLGSIVPGVTLPVMEPHQTVANLLDRLKAGDLLHVDLAQATASNSVDAGSYLAEALSDGGVIDVLPGFRGDGTAPLVRMTITRSRAVVPIERSSTKAAPVADNAVVRIESRLLGTLALAGPPVVDGLVHGLPLSAVPGGSLPVAGGVLGGGLPLDRVVSGLGLRSGAGFVEVGPGQDVSLLCDGALAPLCSEVSVGAAKAPVLLPNGATRSESSTVTMHLFKSIDSLAPGTGLGTALATPAVTSATSAETPAGAAPPGTTPIPGVRLVTGGAVAEAGGARVLGAETVRTAEAAPPAAEGVPPAAPPAPTLPRTGGRPFTSAAAAAFIASSLAIGALARLARRRNTA